jgi:UDP-N-acetylglucosamine/UDP-N-acetylgalactosamine diphosphorylase
VASQVGVLCKRGGVYSVVEYSEMDKATAELRDPASGELVFNAGNLCIHYYSTAFLATECSPAGLPKVRLQPASTI